MVNLAINYLRGPCGPLPYEGAIRLLIDWILLWNLREVLFKVTSNFTLNWFTITLYFVYTIKKLLIGL